MTPNVRCSPVPAFPAVGIIKALAIAQNVIETCHGTHLVMEESPVVVRRSHGSNCRLAILFSNSLNLRSDNVQCLVPGDTDKFVLTLSSMTLAIGIEVFALHGVFDAIFINPLAFCYCEVCKVVLRGGENLLPRALIVHEGASSLSSSTRGRIRVITPSFT